MPEARSLIFPRAIAMGARPLTVPGGSNVLVASAFFPFRLSDGSPVLPATWYETVSTHAGVDVIPDTMVPLPGAELLVLGMVPPVGDDVRHARVRCGTLVRSVIFQPDPDRPDEPFVPDVRAAVWHEEDNPLGRGGPDDERPPLIVRDRNQEQPIWFGHTPFDHPSRLKLVGTPDVASGTGWPADADPSVLYEAHPAFWAESFSPGDPVSFEGLSAVPLDGRLPPYRITITSGHEDGRFVVETARIHAVTLIPSANVGAMIWRAVIPVGDDILGEKIQALIAALEDADSEPKDWEHWGRIAVDRWTEPSTAMDDRPMLPAALAATVVLPFAMADDDPMKERHAAAEEWMKGEVGMGESNPFAELAPDEQLGLAEQAIEASEKDDAPPDLDEMDAIASAALAASKQRHADAGFKERTADELNAPQVRGDLLEGEIEQRLSAPYQSLQDRNIVNTIRDHEVEGMDPDDIMERLATTRQINPDPPPMWPALDDEEAPRFGEAVYARLADEDLGRHVDVSGAMVTAQTEDGSKRRIADRRFEGVFAEDTRWEGTEFLRCEFVGSSFARARFHACEFRDCTFRDTNLSKAKLAECTLLDCTFAELRLVEPTWLESRFERCLFDDVQLSNAAMSDSTFAGGSWKKLQIADGLLMDMTYVDVDMEQVTLSEVMLPQNRFERIKMTKVWVMGKGPAGSQFVDVEGDTCGFLGNVRFDQSTFSSVRFTLTGFTSAVFADTEFSPDCLFDRCDLSSAIFFNAAMEGIRFVECSMTGSRWMNVTAPNAWFYGSLLRGVNFGDTELANAVFADADLEGTRFLPDKTIGADFRGTVRADAGDS